MDKIVANLQAEEQAQTSDTETPEVETNEQDNNTPGDVVEQPVADAQAPQETVADSNQQPEELDFIAIQQDQVNFARELQNEWYTPEQIQYAQQIYWEELQKQLSGQQKADTTEVEEEKPVETKVDRAQRLQETVNSSTPEEKKEEPLSEEEQENYRKLYESEVSKRIEIQWKNSELEALVKYQQSMLDKQGDKQLNIIDKQKEMEVELRRAQAAQTPEEIIPLSQSYQIYQENKTPIHKYRLINQALDLVQKVTWVSAEDYLQQIFLTENKDIPNIEWVAPTAKAPEPEKKMPISF